VGWDDEAAGWDENPAVRVYAKAAFVALKKHLVASSSRLAGARILDFGCGTGLLTAAMADEASEVVGLDLSAPMVAVLRGKALPNVTPLSGELADHELGAFDVVTCSSVCAFLPDYPGTVRDLVALLRPGGWFVQLDWELDPSAEEPFGLGRDDIQACLTGAGLCDVEVRTAFEAPFEGQTMAPLMGAGRKA